MVMNRNYELEITGGASPTKIAIGDLSTYIDPVKFNYIFADTSLEAMNFWVQAKSIESQIALNNAQASKINAETKRTEEETKKTSAETESVWSGIELLKTRTTSEEAKTNLTRMQTELTEAMREKNWADWEKAKAETAEISRIMEKLDKEIEGMGLDNEIKNKSKEAIIGNYFADLKVKGQQIIESNSKTKINEKRNLKSNGKRLKTESKKAGSKLHQAT